MFVICFNLSYLIFAFTFSYKLKTLNKFQLVPVSTLSPTNCGSWVGEGGVRGVKDCRSRSEGLGRGGSESSLRA